MDFDQIMRDLKNKIYHPVYFLCGDEPYFTDQISDYIEENVLSEQEKGFNQTILYGRDSNPKDVADAAWRYPMMANNQVIIVKEAQSWKEKDMEPIVRYLKSPSKTTVLVINYKYKKPDGRTENGKLLQKAPVYFESRRLYDNKIPGWINSYVERQGYAIAPQAAQMLIDFLGSELSKISNELNKLFIIVPKGNRITPEHVEKNIGISKEYSVFELNNALGMKDVLKANRIINHFGANPSANAMPLITGAMFSYFSKLFRYHFLTDKSEKAVAAELGVVGFFAKDYINAAKRYHRTRLFEIIGEIREYDMRSKGLMASGVSDHDLLKELVYKILH